MRSVDTRAGVYGWFCHVLMRALHLSITVGFALLRISSSFLMVCNYIYARGIPVDCSLFCLALHAVSAFRFLCLRQHYGYVDSNDVRT